MIETKYCIDDVISIGDSSHITRVAIWEDQTKSGIGARNSKSFLDAVEVVRERYPSIRIFQYAGPRNLNRYFVAASLELSEREFDLMSRGLENLEGLHRVYRILTLEKLLAKVTLTT